MALGNRKHMKISHFNCSASVRDEDEEFFRRDSDISEWILRAFVENVSKWQNYLSAKTYKKNRLH